MPKSSDKSLKKRNQPQLIVFLSANIVLIGIVIAGADHVTATINLVLKGDLSAISKVLALPTLGTLIVGLISWMIPRYWKEVLIFWRKGPRSLPSSEAFSKVAANDPRIGRAELTSRLGELPIEPEKESSLWYTIYLKHRKELSVEDANGAYLLYRDMTGLIPALLLALCVAGPLLGAGGGNMAIAAAVLLGEFLMAMFAARNAGVRLVANVLALESAKPHKTEAKPEAAPKVTRGTSTRTPKKKAAGSE